MTELNIEDLKILSSAIDLAIKGSPNAIVTASNLLPVWQKLNAMATEMVPADKSPEIASIDDDRLI